MNLLLIHLDFFFRVWTNECARSMTECWLAMHTNGIIKTVLSRRLAQIKWLCRIGEIYLPINDHNTSIEIDHHFRWMQYWHWFNHCRSIQLDRFQIIGHCFGHYKWLACGLSVVGKKKHKNIYFLINQNIIINHSETLKMNGIADHQIVKCNQRFGTAWMKVNASSLIIRSDFENMPIGNGMWLDFRFSDISMLRYEIHEAP